MKIQNLKYLLGSLLAAPLLLSSCDSLDGESGSGPDNGVYIDVAGTSRTMAVNIDRAGGVAIVKVRLANPTSQAVNVSLNNNPTLLADFNQKNKKDFKEVPSEVYELQDAGGKPLEGGVVIQPGQYSASIIVRIKAMDEKKFPINTHYAIPLSVSDATGGMQVLPSSNHVILQIARPLITSVAKISYGNFYVQTKKDYNGSEWTAQLTAHYHTLGGYQNLPIFYITDGKATPMYTRIQKGKLQVQNFRDGDDTWTPENALIVGQKWMQFTFVYRNKKLEIYVNAQLIHTFSVTEIHLLQAGQLVIGNELLNGDLIRELRFWDKALSLDEINEYLYLPVDPKTPHLEVYVPFTKETGIKDVSVNANVTGIGTNTEIKYIENVKFPSEKLVIETTKTIE